jgi:hypothetical protein
MTPRQLAAVHEAAHLVIALAVRCDVASVGIGPEGAGNTRIRMPRGRRAIDVRLAGAAGEALALDLRAVGLEEAERRCAGGRTDFGAARAEWGPGADSFLAWRWTRVVDLLERRWPAVEALASALEREGTIDGSRALEIVRAASRDERGRTRRIDGQFRAQFW